MTTDPRNLVRQATQALRLRDIVLYRCAFSRPDVPPTDGEILLTQQNKRAIAFEIGEKKEGDAESRILQVIVGLGVRLVSSDSDTADNAEPQVFFCIEADYLVEYTIATELGEDAIVAFAELNAVHNVWPFWRQHVFDIVQRARLPQLEVPLMAGVQF